MNKIVQAITNIAKGFIFSPKNKDFIITKLNQKINIPIADEEDERLLLEGIYDSFEEIVNDLIDGKK
tara:strand:+ start:40 stop:240 length:201 start_codon:yes stop_codon:yes gene_type:complete